MLYVLIDHYFDFLDAHGFSFLRVMRYVEFRAVAAIIVSFLLVMVLAPRTIRWLVRLKIGDHPEFYNAKLGVPYIDPKNVGLTPDELDACIAGDLQWN